MVRDDLAAASDRFSEHWERLPGLVRRLSDPAGWTVRSSAGLGRITAEVDARRTGGIGEGRPS